jgi:hypothetical protein
MPILTAANSPQKRCVPVWKHFLVWAFVASVLFYGCVCLRPFWSAALLIPAIYDGEYNRVEAALSWGADVNGCKPDGFTPLMRAVSAPLQESKRDFVTLLLAHGAKVNQRDEKGLTALDYADSDVEIARILKQHGAME